MLFLFISGDKFDIKDYHHVFLSAGPMGLDTLEEAVDEYIENCKRIFCIPKVFEDEIPLWQEIPSLPLAIIQLSQNYTSV